MKKLFYSLALILFATIAHAGSVRLYNDTSFPLTAEVLSADGKTLGKKEVNEHQTVTWEGGWSGSTTGSETPYTVRWFCKVGGKAYSLCSNVGTGAMVAASVSSCFLNTLEKKTIRTFIVRRMRKEVPVLHSLVST